MGASIAYIMRVSLTFVWVLATGKLFTGGWAEELIGAFYISKWAVPVFLFMISVGDWIIEKIVKCLVFLEKDNVREIL